MSRRAILIPIVLCLFSLSCSFFSTSGVTNTPSAGPSLSTAAADTATPKPDHGPASSPSSTQPIRARIGEVITDHTLRIVVHGWNIVTASFNILPKPGDKLVKVDFSIVNIGEEPLGNGVGEWRLEDTNGNAYDQSGYDQSGNGVPEVLFQGERVHISKIFGVPENSNGLILDFGMWANGEYVANPILFPFQELLVDLGSEPSMGDLAIAIPGEVKPKMESLGSAVACGDWTIQVLHVREQTGSNFMPVLPEGVLHFGLGEITMTNQGTDTRSLNYGDFWMQDPTGLRFDPYPAQVADMGSNELDGSYAPGEQKTGIVGFGIPVNWGPMWLVFWCGGQSSPAQAQKVYVSIPVLEK
jgi:hypothetical protein